ncbi:MAG: RNA methyltransferase [Acholeplasmatales bacterium]|nr:MAG: RNA methyltransferase [Acholeplasmatales bacterium]
MITSVDNPRVKELAKLQLKKYRDRFKQCLIEGHHLVEAAQAAGLLEHVYVLQPEPDYPNATELSEHVMKKITQAKTVPAVIGVCKTTLPDTIGERVLFLERIQDPGNMGALIRTAIAFGFTSLVLDGCVDVFNAKVLRATQGAIFQISVSQQDIKTFKMRYPTHTLYAAVPSAFDNMPARPNGPFCLMLGHEGQGLRDETVSLADATLTIPMQGFDSLNVSVAGAILMHALSCKPIFKDD